MKYLSHSWQYLTVVILLFSLFLSVESQEPISIRSGPLPENSPAEIRLGNGYIEEVTASSDGNWLAYITSIGLALQEKDSSDLLWYKAFEEPVKSVDFSPAGTMLATLQKSNQIIVYETTTGQILYKKAVSLIDISIIKWNPGGEQIAIGNLTGDIQILDAEELETENSFSIAQSIDNPYLTGVTRLAWNPAGTRLAIGEKRGALNLWNIQTREIDQLFVGEASEVNALAWSSNGKYLASSTQNGDLRVWDTEDNSVYQQYFGIRENRGRIYHLNFSNDDSYLSISSSNETIYFLDIAQNEIVATLSATVPDYYVLDEPRAMLYTYWQDSNTLMTVGASGHQYVWNFDSKELIYQQKLFMAREEAFDIMAASPITDELVLGRRNGEVIIWNREDNSFQQILEPTGNQIIDVAWSGDGRLIAWSIASQVRVWSKDFNTTILVDPNYQLRPTQIDFQQNQQVLSVVSRLEGIKQINLLEEPSSNSLIPNSIPGRVVYSLSFSPDDRYLALGGSGVLQIIDASTGEVIERYSNLVQEVTDIHWLDSTGRIMVSLANISGMSSEETVAGIIEISSDMPPDIWQNAPDDITSIAFSGNELFLAISVENVIQLWDYNENSMVSQYSGHTKSVINTDWLQDTVRVASVSRDGTIIIWEASQNRSDWWMNETPE